MDTHATPKPGDVVIEVHRHDGRVEYTLRHGGGPDQYLVRSRNEALSQALQFAARFGVEAWLTEDGVTFVWLDDWRRTSEA